MQTFPQIANMHIYYYPHIHPSNRLNTHNSHLQKQIIFQSITERMMEVRIAVEIYISICMFFLKERSRTQGA